ncbi:MAG TPA: DUF5808 domain-containing protein [Verrucomicrobiae bacterium]|nr:DUF5808 domain-containing protein [Verrucomicrobiae bacterium]
MVAYPQLIFGAAMLSVAVLVGWLYWALPTWSRPGIFFAVTVVPSFRNSPEAAQVLRGYRMQALAHVAIGFALILSGALSQQFVWLVIGVLWLGLAPLFAIAQAHKRALAHAVAVPTVREASLSPRTTQLPGGWIVQVGPFAILIVTAAYLWLHWSQIPNRFPVHWGVDGMPNGWSERTPGGVFGPLLFAVAMVTGISIIAYGVLHLARRVPLPAGVSATDPAQRIALFLIAVEFFLSGVFSLVALLPFTGSPGAAPIVILALAMLGAAIFLRGWFSRQRDAEGHAPGDGTPDSCWKLGLFYYNPDDAALLVEKRIGIGYTLNFARTPAWICLTLVLFLPIFLLFLIYHTR